MHPDTAAAIRLLVLALENHPEDLEILQAYGDMAEHLADLVDDYLDEDDQPPRCNRSRRPAPASMQSDCWCCGPQRQPVPQADARDAKAGWR